MKKKLTQILGIKYPIFQAPMAGGITTPDFISRISEFGMLGFIASGYLALAQIEYFIKEVKARTSHPFSLNLFVDYTRYGNNEYPKPQQIIDIEKELGIFSTPDYKITHPPKTEDIVSLAIREKVPIISTTFGLLKRLELEAIKEAGIILFTTVNSTKEIETAIEKHQSNFIIYQNSLAGGHKGGFSSEPHSREKHILNIMRRRYPDSYFVTAGGIVCKKDIENALHNGFDAVQIGSAFLTTKESSAPDIYKKAIVSQGGHDKTIVTKSITGKQARGIANHLAKLAVSNNPGFPHMHYATSGLRQHAKSNSIFEYQSLWAGGSSFKIDKVIALDDFMNGLVK